MINIVEFCHAYLGPVLGAIYIIEKSASAGAIGNNMRCVRNNYRGATVRAPHAKIFHNPTSAVFH